MFLFHPELIEFFAIKQKAGKRINVKKMNIHVWILFYRLFISEWSRLDAGIQGIGEDLLACQQRRFRPAGFWLLLKFKFARVAKSLN